MFGIWRSGENDAMRSKHEPGHGRRRYGLTDRNGRKVTAPPSVIGTAFSRISAALALWRSLKSGNEQDWFYNFKEYYKAFRRLREH